MANSDSCGGGIVVARISASWSLRQLSFDSHSVPFWS